MADYLKVLWYFHQFPSKCHRLFPGLVQVTHTTLYNLPGPVKSA